MPDISAARPSAGAPVESAWGGQVHDLLEGLQGGTVTVSLSNANSGNVTLVFPRPYATPPAVVVSQASNSAGYIVAVGGLTASQVIITAAARDSGTNATVSLTVTWLALGTPA